MKGELDIIQSDFQVIVSILHIVRSSMTSISRSFQLYNNHVIYQQSTKKADCQIKLQDDMNIEI